MSVMMNRIYCLSAFIILIAASCSKSPVADFSYSKPVRVGEEVTFNNLSENAGRYAWDFGDGHTSVKSNPVHTFGKAGTCTVSLQAIGEEESTYASKELLVTGITYAFRNRTSVDFQAFYSFYVEGNQIVDFVEHGTLLRDRETVAVITERTSIYCGIIIGETLILMDEFPLTPDKHNHFVLID
jgi:PKD repeat protein